MPTDMVPLKYVVTINATALPETTDPSFAFRYVDISSVMPGAGIAMPDDLTSFGEAPSRARRTAPPGAVVVSTVRTYLRAVARVPESDNPLVFSTGFATLEAKEGLDSRFLAYACQSDAFVDEVVARSVGVSYPAINSSDLGAIPIPLPPVEEQRGIADFLDDQVARIEELVVGRRSQKVLLGEAHHSAMDALVTGAEATPSHDARWLPYGRVPDSWMEGQLRNVRCTVETGPFGSQLHADEYVDNGWPVINPASIQDGHLVALQGMSISDRTRDRLARHVLHPGDVVFGRRGELGRAAVVRGDNDGWVCGTGSLVVRLQGDELSPDYLYRLLSTKALKHFFDVQSVGSTMANLNTGILLGMPLLLPPRREQDAIVGACSRTEEAHRRTVETLEASVALLEERKRSLITAAVTGEMDVTTAKPISMGRWVPGVGADVPPPAPTNASSLGGI